MIFATQLVKLYAMHVLKATEERWQCCWDLAKIQTVDKRIEPVVKEKHTIITFFMLLPRGE